MPPKDFKARRQKLPQTLTEAAFPTPPNASSAATENAPLGLKL